MATPPQIQRDMNATKKEEFTRVQRTNDNKYNLINAQGKFLFDKWFEWIDDFDEYDRAVVYRTNGEKCKIDKQGRIVGYCK